MGDIMISLREILYESTTGYFTMRGGSRKKIEKKIIPRVLISRKV